MHHKKMHHLNYMHYSTANKHWCCPKHSVKKYSFPPLTYGQIPDISPTTAESSDISRFSRQVVKFCTKFIQ